MTKTMVSISRNNMFGFWGVFVTHRGDTFMVAKCETRERALEIVPAIEKMVWA